MLLSFPSAAQAVAFEFDAMGVVNDAVQDGIAKGWICNDVVPLSNGDLACDQQRAFVVAIIDDFQKVSALFGG